MGMHLRMAGRVAGWSLCLGLVARGGLADEPPRPAASGPGEVSKSQQERQRDGMPDLVAGLKDVEGCLGVETAQTSSGKQVIFAWFENRAAAMRWYRSPMHRGIMRSMTDAAAAPRVPMADVPDGVPILAIASITLADASRFEGVRMPISQIAIELYTPLPGGLFLGGTFAPKSLKVPGLVGEATVAEEPSKPEVEERP